MRKIKILLICLALINSSLVFAKEKEDASSNLDRRVALLDQMMKQFESLCIDSKGEILDKTVIVDREAILNDGKVLNCRDEAIRLGKMLNELQTEIDAQKKTAAAKADAACLEVQSAPGKPLAGQDFALMQAAEKVAKQSQENQCKKQSALDCSEDVACNILRATLAQPTKLLSFIPPKYRPEVPTCVSGKDSDCVTEFFNGVVKDLWSNLTGLWDLAKMAASASKKMAVNTWEYLWGVEDKTSDAALASSKQSDSSLAQFKKDPIGFIKNVGIEIWNMMNTAIKENFGCEKWDGVPHFSNCTVPLSTWDCSTCGQKMNAVCGVAGVLGGEVVAAWLTGGAVSLAGKAASKGAAHLGEVKLALMQAMPALKKVAKVTTQAAKVLVVPLTKSLEIATKLIKSETSMKILAFAKKAAQPAVNAAIKLSQTKAMTITVKVVKGATSPVTSYMKLLDKSFDAGMLAGDKFAAKTAQRFSKFSETMQTNEKIGHIDDIVVNTKEIDGISSEVVKSKLKEKGVSYEDVKLPDGTSGARIKVDPSCSVHGGHSVLIK